MGYISRVDTIPNTHVWTWFRPKVNVVTRDELTEVDVAGVRVVYDRPFPGKLQPFESLANKTYMQGLEDLNLVTVAMFAWDGNSYVGNEYYLGKEYLSVSGDPAAAACSAISELMNPDINRAMLNPEKITYLGPNGSTEGFTWADDGGDEDVETLREQLRILQLQEPGQKNKAGGAGSCAGHGRG